MSEITAEEWVFPNNVEDQPTHRRRAEDMTVVEDIADAESKKVWKYMFVKIDDTKRPKTSTDGREESLGFTNHRQLGSFRIDGDLQFCDIGCEPNYVKEDIDLDQISKMSINLMDGYEKSSLIKDYKTYRETKWQFFLKWIQKSQCLEDTTGQSVPHFIAFGGLFTSLMSTPNKFESWTLLVAKHKNSIIMNKIRRPDDRPTGQPKEADRTPYLTAKVTQILTTPEGQPIKDSVNEFEKFFTTYETYIGSHRLLLLSELDAKDEEDNQYAIKCAKNLELSKKWFNWWSNCVISDIDYVMIGLTESSDVLTNVRQIQVEELSQMFGHKWETKDSFDFVNRLLDFIKNLLESANDLEVFRITFSKKETIVRSAKQWKTSNEDFLPKWFTSGADDCKADNEQTIN